MIFTAPVFAIVPCQRNIRLGEKDRSESEEKRKGRPTFRCEEKYQKTWNKAYSITPGIACTLRWVTWSSLVDIYSLIFVRAFNIVHIDARQYAEQLTTHTLPAREVKYLASYINESLWVRVPLFAPTQDLMARNGPDWRHIFGNYCKILFLPRYLVRNEASPAFPECAHVAAAVWRQELEVLPWNIVTQKVYIKKRS